MINVFALIIVFAVIFIVSFLTYYYHYDKLVTFHKYALIVDVLVWIGATITIITAVLFYDVIEKYNYLLWMQIIFAISSLNIHLTRFIIGVTRK